MKHKYTYEEIFQRNIGVFTKEEQERIRNLKVAIAGAGGLGGPVAIILARLGVGEIRIADPDCFEVSNINRQFGAYVDTLGRNKAVVIGEELLRINPSLILKSWDHSVMSSNVREFLNGADAVVDGIDFYAIGDELALHKEAARNQQWVFTAQNAGTLFSVISFNPLGMTFEDMFVSGKNVDLRKLVEGLFPILPEEATPEKVQRVLNGEHLHIPALATAPPMGGAFVAEEIVKILIRKNQEYLQAPDLYMVDIRNLRIIFYKNGKIQKG